VKIGKANNVAKRVETLQTGSPYPLKLLVTVPCRSEKHAEYLEQMAHRIFKPYRIRGEWFDWTAPVRRLIRELQSAAEQSPESNTPHGALPAGRVTGGIGD
jgi:hypothetical protein